MAGSANGVEQPPTNPNLGSPGGAAGCDFHTAIKMPKRLTCLTSGDPLQTQDLHSSPGGETTPSTMNVPKGGYLLTAPRGWQPCSLLRRVSVHLNLGGGEEPAVPCAGGCLPEGSSQFPASEQECCTCVFHLPSACVFSLLSLLCTSPSPLWQAAGRTVSQVDR